MRIVRLLCLVVVLLGVGCAQENRPKPSKSSADQGSYFWDDPDGIYSKASYENDVRILEGHKLLNPRILAPFRRDGRTFFIDRAKEDSSRLILAWIDADNRPRTVTIPTEILVIDTSSLYQETSVRFRFNLTRHGSKIGLGLQKNPNDYLIVPLLDQVMLFIPPEQLEKEPYLPKRQ